MKTELTVITIDNNHHTRATIRTILEPVTNITLIAEGWIGEHLSQLVTKHQPDIALINLALPQDENRYSRHESQFDTLTAVVQLRQQYPNTQFVIITEYLSPALVRGAIQAGARGYLLKEDTLALHLINAIQAVYHQGLYLSGQVGQQLAMLPTKTVSDTILTKRQQQILQAITTNPNLSYAHHAQSLSISTHTFSNHLRQIFDRLDANNITAAILKAITLGIIHPPYNNNYQQLQLHTVS